MSETLEVGATEYAPGYDGSPTKAVFKSPVWSDLRRAGSMGSDEAKNYSPTEQAIRAPLQAEDLAKVSPTERPMKEEVFLAVAHLVATRSTCSRMHVGCVITDIDGEKIAVGYNGGPKGGSNECRRTGAGVCGHIHAEVNAAIKTNFDGPKVAYVTISPCENCAVALVNVGVVKCIVSNVYRDRAGIKILEECGVEVFVVSDEVLGAKP